MSDQETPDTPTSAEPPVPAVSAATSVVRVENAPRHGLRILRPVATAAETITHQKEVREYVHAALEKGRDYGIVPGTKKNTLLKPGAETVTIGFGCVAVPRILEQEVNHTIELPWRKRKKEWRTVDGRRQEVMVEEEGKAFGLYRYVVAVDIVDPDGVVRGTGIGSCSSLESKYCDRPRDCENTVLKMARKRAHVAAVLDAFGLSDEFTQDVDEPHVAEAVGVGAKDSESGLFAMPFGPTKGTAIADLPLDELRKAQAWAKSKNKFQEFVDAVDLEFARRGTGAPTTASESAAAPTPATASHPSPVCPKCGSEMWDNRTTKKNVRAPDYKCKQKECDGVIWLARPEAKKVERVQPPLDRDTQLEMARQDQQDAGDIQFAGFPNAYNLPSEEELPF